MVVSATIEEESFYNDIGIAGDVVFIILGAIVSVLFVNNLKMKIWADPLPVYLAL